MQLVISLSDSRYNALPLLLFFFSILPPPPRSTLFPYTTLFRSRAKTCATTLWANAQRQLSSEYRIRWRRVPEHAYHRRSKLDRKSSRLNSSHLVISYAVFCLKKKKKKINK